MKWSVQIWTGEKWVESSRYARLVDAQRAANIRKQNGFIVKIFNVGEVKNARR
jgi:hypothetical protein